MGIEAPWRWLRQAVALLRRHPRTLFLGALLLVLVALLPTLLQLILLPLMPSQAGFIQGLGFALSLLLYPPAVGGYYRLLHAADGERGPSPTAVLDAYVDAPLTRRMVVLNLLFVSLTLLVISLLSLAFGGEALMQFLRELSALQPGAKVLPAWPRGALPLLFAMALVGVALVSAQGLASAEAALRERPPLSALPAALLATWRNFVALLLFFVPVSVLAFLLGMLVALAGVLLGTVVGTVLGNAATVAVALVIGLLAALALYALLFAFFYYGWRELFDQAPTPTTTTAHSIAA